MSIVDTHSHVGLRERMPPNVPAVKHKHPVEPVERLIEQMNHYGVHRAILVQVTNWWDNTYICRCVVEHPGMFGAVVHLDETDPQSVETLDSLAANGYIHGIRLACRTRLPRGDPLALWRKAMELDLVISAGANIVDHFAEGLEQILRVLPQLRVTIEHMGRPDVAEAPPYPRFRALLALARFPNIYMNVDGFYAYRYPTDGSTNIAAVVSTPPYDPYLPFVRMAYDAFGPHRLMWGSDFPYTFKVNGYDAGLKFIRQSCGFLTSEDKDLILGRNAAGLYRLDQVHRAS